MFLQLVFLCPTARRLADWSGIRPRPSRHSSSIQKKKWCWGLTFRGRRNMWWHHVTWRHITSHDKTSCLATNHIASRHVTSPHCNHITTSHFAAQPHNGTYHITSRYSTNTTHTPRKHYQPPPKLGRNGRRLVHTNTSVWAWRWLIALR